MDERVRKVLNDRPSVVGVKVTSQRTGLESEEVALLVKERQVGGDALGDDVDGDAADVDVLLRVGWSLKFGKDARYQNPTDQTNPPLSFRLEPETKAIWYAPVEHLQQFQEALVDQSERVATVRAEINLASGRTIESKNALVIGAETRAPRGRLARIVAALSVF